MGGKGWSVVIVFGGIFEYRCRYELKKDQTRQRDGSRQTDVKTRARMDADREKRWTKCDGKICYGGLRALMHFPAVEGRPYKCSHPIAVLILVCWKRARMRTGCYIFFIFFLKRRLFLFLKRRSVQLFWCSLEFRVTLRRLASRSFSTRIQQFNKNKQHNYLLLCRGRNVHFVRDK